MGKFLSQAQIDEYHKQGFISPVDVFSEDEAAEYLHRLEEAEAAYPEHLNAENRNNAHLVLKCLDELAHHPIILDAIEDLVGPEFSLWGSVLFIKEPQTKHFVSWHQDSTYDGIEPKNYATPWIALTPSNLESGCMTMVPGTHKDGIRGHDDTYSEDNILTRGQNIPDLDLTNCVDLILRPGQMSIHHAQVVHASQPNKSQQRRVGYALQGYAVASAKQSIGENYWMPIRGQASHPDLIEQQRPQNDMDDAGIEQRRLVNANFSDILYRGADKVRAY